MICKSFLVKRFGDQNTMIWMNFHSGLVVYFGVSLGGPTQMYSKNHNYFFIYYKVLIFSKINCLIFFTIFQITAKLSR